MDEGFILLPVHNLHRLQFNGRIVLFGIDHASWRIHTMDVSNNLLAYGEYHPWTLERNINAHQILVRKMATCLPPHSEAFIIYCSDRVHIIKAFTWEKLLDSRIPPYCSLFQSTLAITKCNPITFSRATVRKLASELLEPFIPHRKLLKL